MQRLLYPLATVLIGVLGLPVHAEVIILRNGDRIEGEITEQTAESVSVRRPFKDSKITYVEEIKRTQIARIEALTDERKRVSSQPAEVSPATTTEAERPDVVHAVPLTEAERTELLGNATDRWKTGDYATAGIVLTRLINSSHADELAEMSAQVERKTEMSLADLAAETHLRAALERANGRIVRLLYVTEYEKPSLVPRLVQAYEDALAGRVHLATDSKPRQGARARLQHRRGVATSRPEREDDDDRKESKESNRGKDDRAGEKEDDDHRASGEAGHNAAPAIGDWIEQPESFTGSSEEARAMLGPINHAMSLLSERIRLDPAVRTNSKLRTELTQQRTRLGALNKTVAARAGAAAAQEKADRAAERRDRQGDRRQQFQPRPRDENDEYQAEVRRQLQEAVGENDSGEFQGDARKPEGQRGARRESSPPPEKNERETERKQ